MLRALPMDNTGTGPKRSAGRAVADQTLQGEAGCDSRWYSAVLSSVAAVRIRLGRMVQTRTSNSHAHVVFLYGMFMVAWSVLDGVVQAAIMKELRLDAPRAQIVTTAMQFRQRVAVLSSLLRLHGPKYDSAIRILTKVEKSARRNMLVHGHIIVGVPGQLTFVKSSASEDAGFKAKKATFTAQGLHRHIFALTETTDRLQALLNLTDNDTQALADAALTEAYE